MQFKDELFEGTFIKRYKRFFAEIEFKNEKIVAHVPNTGSMKGLIETPRRCRFTYSSDPKRKLKYTLQMLECEGAWVGINTHLPNTIVKEAFEEKRIEHWLPYNHALSEVKISAESRIDLVLSRTGDPNRGELKRFVEIKNVTLSGPKKTALFPDAKTERGRKHLRELLTLKEQGFDAEIFFLVQRTDCEVFQPAADIDPEYARLLKEVSEKGVEVSAYPVEFTLDGITLVPNRLRILF